MYVDVAISTPFGDQPGTVYIYAGAGSRDIINENPIQVIRMNIDFVSIFRVCTIILYRCVLLFRL